MQVDKIFLSANNNPLYLPFLRIVAPAWEKLMSVRPTLVYVSDDISENLWMEDFAEVLRVPNIEGVPSGNHAMASRMFMATQYPGKICMLADIDLLPLSSWYYTKHINGASANSFLFLNGDAYGPIRKFPICHMIADGATFGEVLNPLKLSYLELVASYKGFKGTASYCDICTTAAVRFCDESLLSCLLYKWANYEDRAIVVPRASADPSQGISIGRRIDRSDWRYSVEALTNGLYIDSHMIRPFKGNEHLIAPLVEYLGIPMPDSTLL
jgi:hypothetical protein